MSLWHARPKSAHSDEHPSSKRAASLAQLMRAQEAALFGDMTPKFEAQRKGPISNTVAGFERTSTSCRGEH